MSTELKAKLYCAIREHGMARAGDRLGIAVSGGADSVALLLLLDDLRPQLGVTLTVLHFNHQLRGAESDADEAFVAGLAAARGLELIAGRGDVAAEARAQGWNLEDAARRLRYGFFAAQVGLGRISRVAVAHTADDQAETVLARVARGAGPAGLASIYPVREHIVRPLLGVRRAELRAWLDARAQPWREDASNLDVARLRARIRHRVLPALEKELHPAIVGRLAGLAEFAREDESFWSALVRERIESLARFQNGRIGIRRADLQAPATFLPAASDAQRTLARRLVRGIIARLPGPPRQLAARHVEQVLRLARNSQSGRRTELPGAVAELDFDWVWFEAASESMPARQTSRSAIARRLDFERTIELKVPGGSATVDIPEIRRRIHLKTIDWPVGARDTVSRGEAIDFALLRAPLVLRNWRPGDRIRPLGRRAGLKLKQFLRQERVAVGQRRGWPVLTSGGSVVWTRGLPVAREFSVGSGTQTGVIISEEEF